MTSRRPAGPSKSRFCYGLQCLANYLALLDALRAALAKTQLGAKGRSTRSSK